jgi:nucleotide-binding universal stress UspA family protein
LILPNAIRPRSSCSRSRGRRTWPTTFETEALLETVQEHVQKQFAALRRAAEQPGAAADFRIVVGHPAKQILYAAEREGSVSKQVIHWAH